jgi:hypothetical protein
MDYLTGFVCIMVLIGMIVEAIRGFTGKNHDDDVRDFSDYDEFKDDL